MICTCKRRWKIILPNILFGTEISNYKVERAEPTVPDPPESYPAYVSAPIESMHRALFRQYFNLVFAVGTYFQGKRHEEPVVYVAPEDLLATLDLELEDIVSEDEGRYYESTEALMNIIRDIMHYSPQLSHPYYMFQLVSG